MADVRELLARLNPANVKFDTGRGGLPELTNQDIAGALAFIPAGLGREVLMACYWPDGARLSQRKLLDGVAKIVRPEVMRQSRELSEAHLDLQMVNAAIAFSGGHITQTQRMERESKERRLAWVRGLTWPKNIGDHLPFLTLAIVGELASGHLCATCEGRREILDGATVKICPSCKGTGRCSAPDLQRARALDIDARAFVRLWKPAYEWLLVRMGDELHAAEREFARALSRSEVA
ncbi:hypothetical protein [Xanthomonas citri]|uniref:hypothetical protein n=1 Tax=Xanthomonas citri TaxID=346 RepID=UPI00103DE504|nr:hypothetical protein [Xanthomonas citri]MCC8492301.1 hypothetical protein [Xanthomonas citri pv. fuscans]TBX03202.1 hypothetical protein TP46_12255 [Xanthomonas citri pv. aurantifolii]